MLGQNNFLQDTCEVVSGLFNVVITIIDRNYIRVAGTDHYKSLIGRKAANPNVFKGVIENDRTIIIKDPGNEPICSECKNRNNCAEKAAIYTPLKVNGSVEGGVGIIAFTEEQRRSGLFNDEVFFQFTQKLSELISSKIEAQEYERQLKIHLQENIAILNSVHDGVIAVNREGIIYQINHSASVSFGIDKDRYLNQKIGALLPPRVLERIAEERDFVDVEEKIQVNDVKIPVLITAKSVEENADNYGTVLILKSMKDASSIARRLVHEVDYMVSFDDIVGNSNEVESVKFLAKKIAGSDSTVLIRGESGTGKEMFARAIHSESKRHNGPFIAVNCAAIPEPLLESELFGYEDGAFTGAKRGGKIGKCELAIGGTLFLDEVGDIPLFLQSKFLRMLQERSIERVGGSKTIPVDIRIIAATNRNLEEMIACNEYREDLYYRLNVIPIFLPPLRKRKDDIMTVSRFFLSKYTSKLDKQIHSISREAEALLLAYSWPGNLRELENAIECAVNIETENVLTPQSLPEKIRKGSDRDHGMEGRGYFSVMAQGTSTGERQEVPDLDRSTANLKERRRKVELEEVVAALDKYGWDTKGKKIAAQRLGIGIATLYRILNK